MKLALAGALLVGLAGCNGSGYPVALTGSGSTTTSGGGTSSGTVTTGTGTTQCGDGTAFLQCVSLPVAGATYDGTVPLAVMATAPDTINGWHVYVDGVLADSSVSTTAPNAYTATENWNGVISGISPGSHEIAVSTWPGAKESYAPTTAKVTVNVVASPLPTPSASAKVYSNVEAATGTQGSWQICNGSCSGSWGTGTSTITLDATNAPTLSGASMEETSTGAGFNTLGYLKPPCPTAGCTSVSNFLDDVWFYIPSTTTAVQALEFDPDLYDGSYEYFMSMQCDSASGDWRFWNMNAGQWTTQGGSATVSTYPCQLLTQTNQWHHFQLYGVMNYSAHTYTYQTFVVDGVTVFQNLGNSYPAKPYSSGEAIVVEQQIDNNATATSNSVYYDDYSLTVW
jgi:hypothetical protein